MKQLLFTCIVVLAAIALNAQTNNDTTAIKQLLEKESATWRSGDIQAHADCWHIQPYSKILVSTPDGKSFVVPPDMMIHPPTDIFGKGGSAANTNYTFSIHGDDAWVSHDEASTAANGSVSYSHEMKILERINNEWKLVAESIHVYKP
jgi:hypothetical protein